MAYNLVKSDSTPLATINDGQTNDTATTLTLVGKNFAGYGTFLNENFVKLLEHFASATEPANKIAGQVWYQTSTKILQVYTGTNWKSISGAQSVADEPTYKVAGDLWFDSVNQQLKVWSGAGWVVIGPSFTSTTGTSGAVADTVIDSSQSSHVVVKFFVQNQLVAVLSKDATFQPATTIPGFPSIKPGLNLARGTSPELVFYENANNASYLGSLAADQYLTKDNALLTSKLVVRNNDGIELEEPSGTVTNFQLNISNNNIQLVSLIRGNGLIIKTKPDNAGGAFQTVLAVDKLTGLITVLNDPTESAGIATKNYVDNRDNTTRTMLQNNVVAINSNVSTLASNTTSVYGNVRTIQSHLGFRKGGAGTTPDNQYTEMLITNNDTVVGNIFALWGNVSAIHSNVLSRGGSGGTVDSSMFSNVRLLQSKVSSLENDALRRDGTLTVTGSLVPDTPDNRNIGSAGFRFSQGFFTTANVGSLTNVSSINTSGARTRFDPLVIAANPITIMGNIRFNEAWPSTSSNTAIGIDSDVRVTGTLRTNGDIVPIVTDSIDIGSSAGLRYDNIWVKTVNAATVELTGGLSSSSAASFGALTIAGDIKPSVDVTYSLGDSDQRFINVYGRNFISDNGVSLNATTNMGIRWAGSTEVADIGTSAARFKDVHANTFQGKHVTLTATGIFVNATNAGSEALDVGTTTVKFRDFYGRNFFGTASAAKYADLAERYETDQEYPIGTLVTIGGAKEITAETVDNSENVFGVISDKPAYLMNGEAGSDATHPAVAMIGRVPVRVVGPVTKGQRLISAGNGCARAAQPSEVTPFNVIGRALAAKTTTEEGLVEATVRMSV